MIRLESFPSEDTLDDLLFVSKGIEVVSLVYAFV
jgi:hypothetical protein